MKLTETPIEPLLETCCQEGLVYRDLSRKTIQWWSKSTRIFMNATGVRFVEELSEERLRRYFFEGRAKRQWKAGTYINYFRALNVFFTWCVKNGHLDRNPLETLELPRPGKRIGRSISEEDARCLLDASFNIRYSYRFERFRNHALTSLLLFTGLRISEALSLGLNDVDLERNDVMVRSGKWNKDRVVPVLPELRLSMIEYLRERDRLNKNCLRLFVSLRGDRALTTSGVNTLVRRLRAATGIRFSAHMLRHTFCTLMANRGANLRKLQRIMGHSNIETTMKYVDNFGIETKAEMLKHPLSGAGSIRRRLV